MKLKSKIVQIPTNATLAQMQSALDTAMAGGWELKFIFTLATNTYAVFVKTLAR